MKNRISMKYVVKIYKKIYRILIMRIRILRFKVLGVNYGKNFKVWGKVIIEGNPKNITLGDNCSINHGVLLEAGDRISCGNNVTISAYSQIHTSSLLLNKWPQKIHVRKTVKICNNVWIASSVIIQAGVEVCDNVIIGANSLVLRSLYEDGFYAGSPVKKIKEIKCKNKAII